MDGFEVQRVAEDEGKFALVASVGEPVPVEGTFAANGDVVAKGLMSSKKNSLCRVL